MSKKHLGDNTYIRKLTYDGYALTMEYDGSVDERIYVDRTTVLKMLLFIEEEEGLN